MLKIERKKLIESELQKHGSILISTISKLAECSEETIRRDITELEKENKLVKIHGGAYLPEDFDKSVPLNLRENLFSDVKRNLSFIAFTNFIKENDVIMLDSSTTCYELAKQIFNSNLKVTIITNSLQICNINANRSKNFKIICVGGTYKHSSGSFVGHEAVHCISQYVADKCFISCSAIDLNFGLLDNSCKESEIRKAFIKNSYQRFFIGDHTKFHSTANMKIFNLDVLDGIITNTNLSESDKQVLKDNGISLYT